MNLANARAEIEQANRILRSRYHYEHPIFGHLANALAALEEPPEPVETVAELKAEAEEAAAVGEETAEPEPPAQRARKRG